MNVRVLVKPGIAVQRRLWICPGALDVFDLQPAKYPMLASATEPPRPAPFNSLEQTPEQEKIAPPDPLLA
jgi:hypothetical protein